MQVIGLSKGRLKTAVDFSDDHVHKIRLNTIKVLGLTVNRLSIQKGRLKT
ncbi:hypothetical protein NEIMUCOT_04869 [Neisseria mucosa ATCC 25996]|uniref:Uncharacterized protein n=1 Tax=Neisseria mucosa (strain ATCC 25996 / DSM 4631 / NCTC 10774 / M26) TaxID=546266 RepID=D2ZW76_NEIM2|nr:hypothetical protein NEIMUCOT_04869 [Neisseria mucosa ATCC 25996]